MTVQATTPTTTATASSTVATTITSAAGYTGGEYSAPKRQKLADQSDSDSKNHEPLLPGLPDHIAQLCLSLVHPPSTLYSVSRLWRRLLYSPSFPPFLSIYALFLPSQSQTETPNFQTSRHRPLEFFSFDPISSNWQILPPPPPPPDPIILRHPSFLSRNLPIQSVSVSGNLVLLAATADHLVAALPRPLIFNPLSQNWGFGPQLSAPRRWCASGTLGGAVFVAGGIGSHYNPDVARSVEKWDLQIRNNKTNTTKRTHNRSNAGFPELGWKWEKLGAMRDGKFSRDAIDAVGWRGKLCMVNVKGNSAKEGVVYDVASDDWAEMPVGMIAGWRGPAAAMDEETLYSVDESKGVLRKYDADCDEWEDILGEERLRGAEQIVAAGGRVCVVRGVGDGILVVDVAASPARLWVVDAPAPGFKAVALHVLPRISRPD